MTLVKFVLIAVATLMLVTFWMNYLLPWAKRQLTLWMAEIDIRGMRAQFDGDGEVVRIIDEAMDRFRRARKEDRL